ncbi:uncharacterized protein LOC127873564 [Dreissena polymorpha]|uniref:uncharacterized protein LOC127873564 n=1 Tax=Dreissena polymorpha TaxID=45954 RepID=UPI002263D952|nr:uncharacterized protein LOC127873564 [Dreissena polymorpha]
MADFHVSFHIAMVIAAVLGELVSFMFFNGHSAWGRRIGDRYLITAFVCQAVLVVILKWIIDHYFSVHGWKDSAILALWLAAIYATLEAPHVVHDHHSLSYFFAHALHKFAVLFVMIFSLHHFRNY